MDSMDFNEGFTFFHCNIWLLVCVSAKAVDFRGHSEFFWP